MKYACLAILVAAAGCTKPNPASCLEDNFCSDPSLPYCDKTGSVGGTAGECIAVTCSPGAFLECEDEKTATTCVSTGDSYSPVPCAYGCGAGGCLPCNTADCEKHIIPRYVPAACNTLTSLPPKTITVDMMLDTTVASQCDEVVSQIGAPEICVVRAPTISIEAGKTLTVKGSRVLALVADRELTIAGVLDVSADSIVNGPGGGFTKSGTDVGQAGGGAGYRTAGAAGGGNGGDGQSLNGGPATANPSTITALLGGTQPTRVAPAQLPGGAGGGLTLVSCRGSISVLGTVDAGGGGGYGDGGMFQPPFTYYKAAGGGSGGTVVMQASAISVTGAIYANGGSGGGGGNPGNGGSDALRSTMPAPGAPGGGINNLGGLGGNGGALIPPTTGQRPATETSCPTGCGAGGASAGFILTYLPAGSTPVVGGATFSPPIEPKNTISTN